VADDATMQQMLTARHADPAGDARIVVATVNKGTLCTMREGNKRKVVFASWAQLWQIAALFVLLNGVIAAITG